MTPIERTQAINAYRAHASDDTFPGTCRAGCPEQFPCTQRSHAATVLTTAGVDLAAVGQLPPPGIRRRRRSRSGVRGL